MRPAGVGFCQSYRVGNILKADFTAGAPKGFKTKQLDLDDFGITVQSSFLERAWTLHLGGQRNSSNNTEKLIRTMTAFLEEPKVPADDRRFFDKVLKQDDLTPLTLKESVRFFNILFAHINTLRPKRRTKKDVENLAPLSSTTLSQYHTDVRAIFALVVNDMHARNIIEYNFSDVETYLLHIPSRNTADPVTLSNIPDPTSQCPEPIGNIRFDSIQNAQHQITENLSVRLKEFRERCFAVLDKWHTQREKVKAHALAMTEARYKEIQSHVYVVRGTKSHGSLTMTEALASIRAISPEELYIFYAKEFLKEELHKYDRYQQWFAQWPQPSNPDAKGPRIYPGIETIYEIQAFSPARFFDQRLLAVLAYYNVECLTAIIAVILSESGHNSGTICGLILDVEAKRDKTTLAHWHIAPLKTKVGSRKEEVLKKNLDSQRGAFEAMEMAHVNYKAILENWYVAPEYKDHLFLRFWMDQAFVMNSYMVGNTFRDYKVAWGLPEKYQLKQLRNQVAGLDFFSSEGNLSIVNSRLNHAKMSTSAKYIMKLLDVFDELIINQFERQIAANIFFAIGGDDRVLAHGLIPADVTPRLFPIPVVSNLKLVTLNGEQVPQDEAAKQLGNSLLPVGNGVSCFDSTDSPNQTIPKGETCDGEQCFGCKHQRIVVTESSIRENINWLHYFADNLGRLKTENPKHWEEIGLQMYAYEIAMRKVIKSSKYKHVYERIEQEVDAANNGRHSFSDF